MADIETSIRPGERAQTIRTETSSILRPKLQRKS